MSEQMGEKAARDPDETDDLAAIVRYHGANEVIDALLAVAEEAYGPKDAEEKIGLLLHLRAVRRAQDAHEVPVSAMPWNTPTADPATDEESA